MWRDLSREVLGPPEVTSPKLVRSLKRDPLQTSFLSKKTYVISGATVAWVKTVPVTLQFEVAVDLPLHHHNDGEELEGRGSHNLAASWLRPIGSPIRRNTLGPAPTH